MLEMASWLGRGAILGLMLNAMSWQRTHLGEARLFESVNTLVFSVSSICVLVTSVLLLEYSRHTWWFHAPELPPQWKFIRRSSLCVSIGNAIAFNIVLLVEIVNPPLDSYPAALKMTMFFINLFLIAYDFTVLAKIYIRDTI